MPHGNRFYIEHWQQVSNRHTTQNFYILPPNTSSSGVLQSQINCPSVSSISPTESERASSLPAFQDQQDSEPGVHRDTVRWESSDRTTAPSIGSNEEDTSCIPFSSRPSSSASTLVGDTGNSTEIIYENGVDVSTLDAARLATRETRRHLPLPPPEIHDGYLFRKVG
ncbi:hypothetical protein P154DRAFT_563389 [Amniculicola lignicola CBS 123094]|uniref:Uncharacterized protein n=1 Tax=Amniculicola lignicola CBS 123094 TaxID=1392246 RepID=A0A6A5WS40_9PLEO|nr:hypothetical protein P154DRAFT_563389 [Amniculicola lignicola CBS 123094]